MPFQKLVFSVSCFTGVPSQVTNLFSSYITSMLQQHAANPKEGWKAKDAAIYIVLALTLKGGTSKLGATQTNSLVNLIDFFSSHVLPELQAAAQPAGAVHPILVADSIKFVTVFRAQVPPRRPTEAGALFLVKRTSRSHLTLAYLPPLALMPSHHLVKRGCELLTISFALHLRGDFPS